MDRKGQMNILWGFQYITETIVFTIEIVQNATEIGYLSLSVEAPPLNLVLYMCQQVKPELDKIKNHHDYTKILSLDVSEGDPAGEPQSSSAVRVFKETRSLRAKVTGKSNFSILN